MLERVKLVWKLVGLYEEVKAMDMAAILKLVVSFAMGLVATAGACYLAADHPNLWHCLVTGGTAGATTALGYAKLSPLSSSGPAPHA